MKNTVKVSCIKLLYGNVYMYKFVCTEMCVFIFRWIIQMTDSFHVILNIYPVLRKLILL